MIDPRKALVISALEDLKKTVDKAGSENADAMEIANDVAFNSETYSKAIEYCIGELGERGDD